MTWIKYVRMDHLGNLAAFGHAKAFELSEDGFDWIGDYKITADEVLGGIAPKANKQHVLTTTKKVAAASKHNLYLHYRMCYDI